MFEDFEVLQPQLQSRPSKLGIKLEKISPSIDQDVGKPPESRQLFSAILSLFERHCNTMQHSRERCYTKCSTCEMCGWSIIAYQDRQNH